MIILRMTTDIKDDRLVVLTLPLEVPTGTVELVVTVESQEGKRPQPWGVPATEIRGTGAGNGSPRDDDTVDQWMSAHHLEKYG